MKKRRKLKKKIKISLIIVLILVILGLVCYLMLGGELKINKDKSSTTKVITTTKPQPKNITLAAVGDCLIHSFVYTAAKQSNGTYSFDGMFTEVKDLVAGHDLAYYNQESIIGGKSLGLSTYPRFNSPEEIGDAMVNLGFNLVGLANNHTMDRGKEAVINSVNYWKTKKGVYYSGQALSQEERDNIKIKEVNGIKYAFLSYTTVTNGLIPNAGEEYLTNVYSEEKAKKDVESVKGKVDLIIVSMHWGEEYQTYQNPNQEKIANYLSSLGVNLIIGAHPHVIQPVKMINDTLVFYSLGNFISAQDNPDRLTGALASLKITKQLDGKITFSDVKINLIYTSFVTHYPFNFKVYPYTKLNNNILSGYQAYYNKYKQILTTYDKNIEVVSISG